MFSLSRSTARLLVIAPFAALLAVACEHNLGPAIGPLATITVTPNPQTLAISALQPFVATGRDAAGNLVAITPVWSVTASGGAINSGSGLFTAGTVTGTFANTVRATSGSIFGTATVTVTAPGTLVAITVTPNPGSALVGENIQFTAAGQDATGAAVALSPAPTWSVVDPTAGTINSSSGLFTAGATPGTYSNTIRATSGGISGFATAIVNATPPPPGPSLGAAESHGILGGSTVSCVDGTIEADVSVWPGTAVVGFPPCTITGEEHAGDAFAQTAQGDLTTAFLELEALACDVTITADLGGTTLAEGVYCSSSSVGVTGTVTLTGNANSLFVIRAASTLTTAGNVVMAGGAQAKNVYWWVGSSATLGDMSQWQGNILALQSITLSGNVTLCGRALARNGGVSLDGAFNHIKLPPVAAATCTFP